AMATTKRGAHLMLSMERLEAITARPPQRIGFWGTPPLPQKKDPIPAPRPPQRIVCSSAQRPLEEVAHFLGGHSPDGPRREVTIVDAGMRKQMQVDVVVPVEEMGNIWESVY